MATVKMHPLECHCRSCRRAAKAEQDRLHKERSDRAKAIAARRKLQK